VFHTSVTMLNPKGGAGPGKQQDQQDQDKKNNAQAIVFVLDAPAVLSTDGGLSLDKIAMEASCERLSSLVESACPAGAKPLPALVICKILSGQSAHAANVQRERVAKAVAASLAQGTAVKVRKLVSTLEVLPLLCVESKETSSLYPTPGASDQLAAAVSRLAKRSRPYPLLHGVHVVQVLARVLSAALNHAKIVGGGDFGWWIEGFSMVMQTFSNELINGGLKGLAWPPVSSDAAVVAPAKNPPQAAQTLLNELNITLPDPLPDNMAPRSKVARTSLRGSWASRVGRGAQEHSIREYVKRGLGEAWTKDRQISARVEEQLERMRRGDKAGAREAAVLLTYHRLASLSDRLSKKDVLVVYSRRNSKDILETCKLAIPNAFIAAEITKFQATSQAKAQIDLHSGMRSKPLEVLNQNVQKQMHLPRQRAEGESDDEWMRRRETDMLLEDMRKEAASMDRLISRVDSISGGISGEDPVDARNMLNLRKRAAMR